jgi:hypothetical protein
MAGLCLASTCLHHSCPVNGPTFSSSDWGLPAMVSYKVKQLCSPTERFWDTTLREIRSSASQALLLLELLCQSSEADLVTQLVTKPHGMEGFQP